MCPGILLVTGKKLKVVTYVGNTSISSDNGLVGAIYVCVCKVMWQNSSDIVLLFSGWNDGG